MAILEIQKDPSPRTLAFFGALLAVFFALIAGVVTWRTGWGTAPKVLLGVGLGLAALYYAVPPVRKPLYLGWTYAAWPIGTTISLVLLAGIYFGVVTPIGILRRTLGRDPMQRGFDRGAATYWQPHAGRPDRERYFKPY